MNKPTPVYILTERGLTVYIDGVPHTVITSDSRFENALDALRTGDMEALEAAVRPAKVLETIVSRTGYITVKGGAVYIDGKQAPDDDYTVQRIIRHAAAELPVLPLVNFFERLQKNPSYRTRRDLLRFLEKGDLPITTSGMFLAYKRVTEDYRDLHTGACDYSIGRTVSMSRFEVDDDPNNTCSAGLHVCSYGYLPHFGSRHGNRVVICEVDPGDVVAIPTDYNDSKMRVCRLRVISETDLPESCLQGSMVYDEYESEDDDDDDGAL